MKYKIIDLQGANIHEDEIYESKEEIREHLISFHSTDYDGEKPIGEFSLDEILEYGEWEIETL